jgi:hypothetical protein
MRLIPSQAQQYKSAAMALVMAFTLSGCAKVIMFLPSVEHCEHVTYQRDYNHVQITADCRVGE